MAKTPPKEPVRRGRGRPARLSRQTILEAGLALLEREPDVPLTLSRVADEVGAVPAALYRHVGSLDELLDGVLGRVLGGIRFQIRRRAGSATQVRDWMVSVRTHLLRYPAVVALIGRTGRTSPAWFDVTSVLIEILEKAGLRDRALAEAYLWIAEVTMGCVVTEATLSFDEQIDGARSALPEMSDDALRRHAPLLAQLGNLDADAYFSMMVDRTIAGIPELATSRPVKASRSS